MSNIKPGMRVRDRVSGFEGIATARCEYLNGCVQIGVQAGLDKDGNRRNAEYIDEQQLEIVNPKHVLDHDWPTVAGTPQQVGGPQDHPRGNPMR